MRTAIMQPYIFPYIGYFQLINAVDTFVILDDVNFIMRGWINRNNILLNNKTYLFSLPLDKASQNKLINETKSNFTQKDKEKFLKTINLAYKKAPYYNDFYPLIEEIIMFNEDDLTLFLENSLKKICNYLGINTRILVSSKIDKDNSLGGQNRIIEICKKTNTKIYINLPGGKDLYNAQDFRNENMNLKFIKMLDIKYKQFTNEFIPNLSFLDALMFNSKQSITNLLSQYTLIDNEGGINGKS